MALSNNRWLDGLPPTRRDSPSWLPRATFVVATTACAAGMLSMVGANNDRIVDLLGSLRVHEKQETQFEALRESDDEIKELVGTLRQRVDRVEETHRHDQETAALTKEYERLLAEQKPAEPAEPAVAEPAPRSGHREWRHPQGRREHTERRSGTKGTAGRSPTVSMREVRPYRYEYRVTMRDRWLDSHRDEYRRRFADGCRVPSSAIVDLPAGFLIPSDGCEPATFDGFEMIQLPADDNEVAP